MLKYFYKTTRYFAAFCFFCIVSVVLGWLLFPVHVTVDPPFIAQPLDISTFNWYDLGAVDLNQDGYLDVFTTNHSDKQSLLIANKKGSFEDKFSDFGLAQSPFFPGLEALEAHPEMVNPGLYIYFVETELYLTHVTDNKLSTIVGTLSIPMQAEINSKEGFDTKVIDHKSIDFPSVSINFKTNQEGQLSLSAPMSVPISIQLGSDTPLNKVFVGFNRINPKNHKFELYLKDRHGIAWSDYNDDGLLDAFIVRGGLYGQMEKISRELSDQFFLSTSSDQYLDVISEKGFSKNNCPGRQVGWVDVNGDELLDLYIACGRDGGFWEYIPDWLLGIVSNTDNRQFPNMLYLQTKSGSFNEVASEYGLDFIDGGTFLWFDVDGDGDMDLLWGSKKEIILYRNSGTQFKAEVLLPDSTTVLPRKFAAADFDSDGDIDVFIGATFGSKLLLNDSGKLSVEDPEDFGLPSQVRTVNWVDFDNDGLLDLYAWPAGIFRQVDGGKFVKTDLLRMPSPYWAFLDARALWFDYDNDGDMDVIIMQRFFPRVIQKTFPSLFPSTVFFLRNDSTSENNWFQVALEGKAGNREAIGASIKVSTNHGSQLQFVGQFESSHYSQGHYRLYFGLGSETEPNKVEIRWPDNSVQEIKQSVNRRILRISR